jgi:hypothetical protein
VLVTGNHRPVGGGRFHRVGQCGGRDGRCHADLPRSCLGSREEKVGAGRTVAEQGRSLCRRDGRRGRARATEDDDRREIMVGGMISSAVLTLAAIPAIYVLVNQWRLKHGIEH